MKSISNAYTTLSNGIALNYYDSNQDAAFNRENHFASTIVLIHGYCGSSAYFVELISQLAQNFRVLAIDLFGHGSTKPIQREVYQLNEQAEYILEWLRSIEVSKFHLYGHSLGGYITLAVAELQPKELQSFGLLHSTALPDSEQAKQNREQAVITVQEKGVPHFVEQLVPKLLAEGHPKSKMLYSALVEIGQGTAAEAVAGYARGMRIRPDRTHIIQNSTLPVLLVSGAQDRIVNAEGTFAGHNEYTVCKVIDNAGHMGMLEEPEQLAEIMKSFVNEQS